MREVPCSAFRCGPTCVNLAATLHRELPESEEVEPLISSQHEYIL